MKLDLFITDHRNPEPEHDAEKATDSSPKPLPQEPEEELSMLDFRLKASGIDMSFLDYLHCGISFPYMMGGSDPDSLFHNLSNLPPLLEKQWRAHGRVIENKMNVAITEAIGKLQELQKRIDKYNYDD